MARPLVLAGFHLAALLREDPGGAAAEPGLVEAVAAQTRAEARRLAQLDASSRRAFARTAAAATTPAPSLDDSDHPRALAMLAAEAPAPQARRWMAAAPSPRRGYVGPPGVRAALRNAEGVAPRDEAVARREVGRGRELLCRIRRRAPDAVTPLLARLDAGEVAAVMKLSELLDEEPAPAHALALLRAVDVSGSGGPARGLGALALGFEGDLDGDVDSRATRRVGAELAELWEAGCLE